MCEGWKKGRREAKFVRTCPGSKPPSLRVAAGSCGGSLPLSPLPPSWGSWWGGGEVTSAPRLAPAPRLGRDSPAGSASGTVAAASREARAGSPAQLLFLPRSVCASARLHLRAPQTAGVSPAQPRSGPRPRRAPLSGCLSSPLRQRFPRLELQVMLSLCCSGTPSRRVACSGVARRKHGQSLQTGLDALTCTL